jgi:hypothetical protein
MALTQLLGVGSVALIAPAAGGESSRDRGAELRGDYLSGSWSTLAAQMKSFCVRPPMACVE